MTDEKLLPPEGSTPPPPEDAYEAEARIVSTIRGIYGLAE